MKRSSLLILAVLFTAAGIGCLATIWAQSFPEDVHVEWVPAATAEEDGVTEYLVAVDGGPPQTIPAGPLDTTCGCLKSRPITISDSALRTYTVRAVNEWGVGAPLTVLKRVRLPAAPTGGKVKAGS